MALSARAAAARTFCSSRSTTAGSAAASTPSAVHFQDRNHLRGFAARSGQVAARHVAGCELQERHQQLRDRTRFGVTQKTAWFMDHRIRCALGMSPIDKLSGHVEADETFIGGKARNMHVSERQRRITGLAAKTKPQSWAS